MDIIIPDSWLREFIKTKANTKKIAECLTLCGPSVEKITQEKNDTLYHIEVTSNRVDTASVKGIAQEAHAILNRFKISSTLNSQVSKPSIKTTKPLLPIKVTTQKDLTKRVMGVVLQIDPKSKTPEYIRQRLVMCGVRPLGAAIDITNYIMLEIGHPTHVFDYDRVKSHSFNIRKAKSGEKITTLDKKTYKLTESDIIIDDSKGNIIDLPGVMGALNSVVTPDTKTIFFFLETINPVSVRRTSLRLGIRSKAAVLNEKDLDPELAQEAFDRGLNLFEKITKAKIASKIIDIYSSKPTPKNLTITHEFIQKIMGVNIISKEVVQYLNSLNFKSKYLVKNKSYQVSIPTSRLNDVQIKEDLVEEIARIYGYHNIAPAKLTGQIPDNPNKEIFDFENKLRQTLFGLNGIEVYTQSLTNPKYSDANSLSLTNPLGIDGKSLRTTLTSSLLNAVSENSHTTTPFHLFELANIYIPTKDDLPKEKMTLGGVITNQDFRHAKGIVERLEKQLNIKPGAITLHIHNSKTFYYEEDIQKLREIYKPHASYVPIPKYPAQQEDITLVVSDQIKIGDIVNTIYKTDNMIKSVDLIDSYENSHTFRINYQNPKKTLTNQEVLGIRKKFIKTLESKFSVKIK